VQSFLDDSLTPGIREAARLYTTILTEYGANQGWLKVVVPGLGCAVLALDPAVQCGMLGVEGQFIA
jgi:hypothetical protein